MVQVGKVSGLESAIMIISASRRTDIPAFYSQWFINRIRAGFCNVPNPFCRQQVYTVSLRPEEVEVIVFWTRNPRPLLAHLDQLDRRGFRYYFHFTIIGNPRELDPKTPPVRFSLDTFRALSDRLGPARVIWRYDPIVQSPQTPPDFHRGHFEQLADSLRGYTQRCFVSTVNLYRKARRRLVMVDADQPWPAATLTALMRDLAAMGQASGIEVLSCASEVDWQPCGISAGKCIDDALIARTFSLPVCGKKDPGQRKSCGCVVSKDIGMYDSCLFGCRYCYATRDFHRAQENYHQHDPHSPSLLDRQ